MLDAGRLVEVRSRLDAIAHGSGSDDSEQAALAGLATAIGLPSLLYPGFAGRAARKRVATAGRGGAGPAQLAAPAQAAAIQVSIDGANHAAMSAATEAAHHAAGHDGHAGGGHH